MAVMAMESLMHPGCSKSRETQALYSVAVCLDLLVHYCVPMEEGNELAWFAEHREGLQRAFRWLAVIIFVLTALQPLFGGFGFFRPGDELDYTAIHAQIANVLFPLALVLFGLAIVAGYQHRNRMIVWSGLLLVSIVSQIGLGYSTRNDFQLTAIHIPSGVLVFALALIVMLLSYGLSFDRETA